MDPQTFAACLLAVTLLTLSPGVDTLLVIRNSARGGWWDGAVSSTGICCGLFVHATVSALGISIILLQTAWAFHALKLAGAAYLVWLGLSSWRRVIGRRRNLIFGNMPENKESLRVWRSFREGFLSNVLNPKTVIFYMAFLPQFINPAEPPLAQSLFIAAIHFCIGMLYQCLLAAMVDKAGKLLQRPGINRVFDALTGSILMFIGLKLATEK
ncbi:MAG: threonine transporter RhtB [Desulfobulbaceae bacterium BRH_c16a]|nr:MAG: threonine transporter RhtB [Desulfobulbaceae bacterium BRH_c16a]